MGDVLSTEEIEIIKYHLDITAGVGRSWMMVVAGKRNLKSSTNIHDHL